MFLECRYVAGCEDFFSILQLILTKPDQIAESTLEAPVGDEGGKPRFERPFRGGGSEPLASSE